MRRPIIAVIGAADASPQHLADARQLGYLIAASGWMVLTGGRNAGVMTAAPEGAKTVPGSLTVGILPDQGLSVSPHLDIAICTDLGNARNTLNVLSSQAVVACGVEGAGTASEVALALKVGKPVILLRAAESAQRFFHTLGGATLLEASSPEQAVELLLHRLHIPVGPAW